MFAIGRHVSGISGFAPALPTPFDEKGRIDAASFEELCNRQIAAGATGLVVCGTTGESSTLRPAEHVALIRIAVAVAKGRVPVIAGAGSNSTAHAIELTCDAEAAGADAILSVAPYYNKPTQSGLLAHFQAIAQSTATPILLYDVPSRTGCSLTDDTICQLADMPHVIGLKDASGDISRPLRLRPRVGDRFRLLSGDDATALAFLAHGGDGCISVASNIAPGLCRRLYLAFRHNEMRQAQRLAEPLAQLTAALFRESSPAPLKYALSLLDLMRPHLRLPMVEVEQHTKSEISTVIARLCEDYADDMIGTPCNAQRSREKPFATRT